MPKCAFKNCNNLKNDDDGVVYFPFPRDPFRCAEWVTVVAQQRCQEIFTPNDTSVVCSEHFTDKDMYKTDKGLKLHETAVPSAISDNQDSDDAEDTSSTENDPQTDNIETESQNNIHYNLSIPSKKSTTRVGFRLQGSKYDLIQTSLDRYRKMLAERNDIIHNLRRKNAKLLKRNNTLKEALKDSRRRIQLDTTIGRNICKTLVIQYIRKYKHLYKKIDTGVGSRS